MAPKDLVLPYKARVDGQGSLLPFYEELMKVIVKNLDPTGLRRARGKFFRYEIET